MQISYDIFALALYKKHEYRKREGEVEIACDKAIYSEVVFENFKKDE